MDKRLRALHYFDYTRDKLLLAGCMFGDITFSPRERSELGRRPAPVCADVRAVI